MKLGNKNDFQLVIEKKDNQHNPLFISTLILISFLFSYLFGYYNKNVIIDTKFDELAYQMDDGNYDNIFHGLINCNNSEEKSFYSNLHYKTVFDKKSEGIESYVLAGSPEGQKPFKIIFQNFGDLSFEMNGISQHYYSDKNYKLNHINIELYNKTSLNRESLFFYLPSSIASRLIELDTTGMYDSYDKIIENLKVSVLANNEEETFIETNISIANIFYDETTAPGYQGIDNYKNRFFGYGESIKKFLGNYFISSSNRMYNYAKPQLGFTTRASFFSFKGYLKEFFYENLEVEDAFVKVYGLKNDVLELIFDEPSIITLFEPEADGQVISIIALLLSVLSYIISIIFVISMCKSELEIIAFENENVFWKELLFSCAFPIMIPFFLIHLIYSLFANNNHSLFLLRMYNVVGNIFTISVTLSYLVIIAIFYYLHIKKARKYERNY